MGNIFEDIAEAFDYFRDLRSNRKYKEELEKNLTNGNLPIIHCLDDGIDLEKGDKK